MRTKYSFINIVVAWAGQFSVLLFQLANRFVFVRTLSAEYLGISGLFSNVLSLLAFAELGIGSAITFSLYIPLVQNDIEKIKSLMSFYKKAYRIIGCVILLGGLLILPIYPWFISEMPKIEHLDFIYMLYVVNSASTYFYSYKRSLIISDQKKYVDSLVYYSRQAVMNICQILILITTNNFIQYLMCQFICQFLENICISRIADKMYPYLKEKNVSHLTKEDVGLIKRNVLALINHKVGGMVVNSISSIMISRFINLTIAGLYSNYLMVSTAVSTIVGQAFSAITGSVGNLEASENSKKIFSVFHVVYFFNFFIIGFCTICLFCLFQPFMRIWVGREYLLDDSTVAVIVLNFYVNGMRKAILTFRDASASYYYDRWKPIFESVINLTLSIIFIRAFGLIGLLVATTISTLTTCSWVEPFVLYRHVFFEKFRDFIKRFFTYAAIVVADTIIGFKLFVLTTAGISARGGVWCFIIQLLAAVVISLVLLTISTCWMQEFKDLLGMCNGLVKKLQKRS